MANPGTPAALPDGFAPVAAQGPGGFDPSMDIFNRLLKSRIVYLGSDVNDQVANLLTAQMLFLEGEDPESDIWLYINSPGGSVTAGMAIYDTMQFISPKVGTICMGLGASMGQFLLCAGEPGMRFALPHARILMHQPLGGVQGQASDIEIHAREILFIRERLNRIMSHHTGQPLEVIERDTDRDRFMSGTEAVEYGLIDRVIESREMAG